MILVKLVTSYIFTILVLASVEGLSQENGLFVADVVEHTEATITGERINFFGHTTQFWDQDSSTSPSVQKLNDLGKELGITQVGIIGIHGFRDPVDAGRYFLKTHGDFDVVVESQGGQHKLLFPDAKEFFIVGGNLSKCLCEGIRDLVRGKLPFMSYGDSIQLNFIKEGLYDGYWRPFEPVAISDFVLRNFANKFNCAYHNYFLYPKPSLEKVLIKSFNEGEEVAQYFDGKRYPAGHVTSEDEFKVININFISDAQLETYLK